MTRAKQDSTSLTVAATEMRSQFERQVFSDQSSSGASVIQASQLEEQLTALLRTHERSAGYVYNTTPLALARELRLSPIASRTTVYSPST